MALPSSPPVIVLPANAVQPITMRKIAAPHYRPAPSLTNLANP
uniref:Uncharacterized protein n=1 Tax=Arundo donax TaxID=35708 RepID=A0A0A9FGV2_ARUDO